MRWHALLSTAVVSFGSIFSTVADTLHVDEDACPNIGTGTELDPYCAIQTAIDHAEDFDEVVVAPGTYNETIDFLGKTITVRSSGGRSVTTIDAAGLNNVVVIFNSGESLTTQLDGFTLTGGLRLNGGGIRTDGSSPTIANCDITGNVATNSGGGMMIQAGNPIVSNCRFIRNLAIGSGGAVRFNGGHDTVFVRCTFVGNVENGVWGGGGFAASGGDLTLSSCSFIGNKSAGNGGGIIVDSTTEPTLTNCVFFANEADGDGEAIYDDNFGSKPTLHNCIVWGHVGNAFAGLGTTTVFHSNIQFGWPGTGNISLDPMFVTYPSPGLDDDWGTTDDDYGDLHLQETSPSIDAGDCAAPGLSILDKDGLARVMGGSVDMGVFEFPMPDAPIPANVDCDDDVDGVDFATFVACFNKAGNSPRTIGCSLWAGDQLDFDDDNDVDGVDFGQFALCFNKAGNPPRTLGCPGAG